MAEVRSYSGESVTVTYDVARCIHAAECVRGLPSVFDVKRKPWISVENASPDQIAEVVRRCPSGALHYVLADGPDEVLEGPVRVSVIEGGPLVLEGPLEIEGVAETRVTLCRCGLTANGLFCDNGCKRGAV